MGAPYLPPSILHNTVFPRAFKKDVRQQIRMIEDMYRQMMPTVDYYLQLKSTTPFPDEPGNTDATMLVGAVVGELGDTQWDPLWGESVPSTMDATGWQQPHSNAVHDATDSRGVFDGPIPVLARIQREAKDRELKRLGFDEIRAMLVHIPVSILDRLGIFVQAGDEFEWDGDRYLVKQHRQTGYWKNTNLRLYVTINADHARIQSS
jgi:hypothetical protein